MAEEISYKLGELNANIDTLKGTFIIINNKLDKVIDSVAVINEKSNRCHERQDKSDEDISHALAGVKDWRENKKRALYIGGTLAVICGMSGTAIGNAFASVGKLFSSFVSPQ